MSLASLLLTAALFCCSLPALAAGQKAAPKSQPRVTKPKQALGMGPLVDALGIAHAQWKKDACLTALRYRPVYPALELGSGETESKLTDYFVYYLYSREAWRDTMEVDFLGSNEPATRVGHKQFFDLCVADVEVDIDKALLIAAKRGVLMDPSPDEGGTRELLLYTLPARGFDQDWLRYWDLDKKAEAALRRYYGKTLWMALSKPDDRTAFIDPATGAVVLDLPRFIQPPW